MMYNEGTFIEYIHEGLSFYKKQYGKTPKYLILDIEALTQLSLELKKEIEMVQNFVFDKPDTFLGMTIVVPKITYGGSMKYGFAE